MLSKPLALSSALWDPSQKGEHTSILLSSLYLICLCFSCYTVADMGAVFGNKCPGYIIYVLTNAYWYGYHFAGVFPSIMVFKRPQVSALRSYTRGFKVYVLSFMPLFFV